MSHRVVRFLIALSLAFAACLPGVAHALDSGDIVVTSIKGEVHVTVDGAERAFKAGGVLDTPASIRTGRDGAIELRQGATTVSVGPETLLEFPAQEKRGGPIDRIVQPRGNAFYGIGKREGRKLRVETPYLVGVIKGTQFNVAAQEDGTTISLFEGRLEVHASDESDVVDLAAGEIAARKRGAQTINVLKMDGKVPATTPRPPPRGGSGDTGAPHSPATIPARDGAGDALLAGAVISNPVMTIIGADADVNSNAGAGLEVRATGADTGANLNVAPPVGGLDAGAAAIAAPSATDTGIAVNVATSAIDTGVTVNAATPAIDTGVTVNVATPAIDTGITASVATPAIDAGASSNIVTPAVAVDAGLGVSVGAGVDAGANVGVDTPAASVDVVAGANPGGRGSSVDVSVTVATPGVDLTNNVNVAVTPGSVDINTNQSVDAGPPGAANVGVAVNTNTGTIDLGLGVAGANVSAGVDLGLDNANTPTTPTTPDTTPSAPVVDVGGVLDGLLRRRGK